MAQAYEWRRCFRCPERVLLARSEATGRDIPLCYPPDGMPANVQLVTVEGNAVRARVVKPGTDGAEFVSHFATCPAAKSFRTKAARAS